VLGWFTDKNKKTSDQGEVFEAPMVDDAKPAWFTHKDSKMP
jgi:hypothetical protein